MRFTKKVITILLCMACLFTAMPVFGAEISPYAKALNVLGMLRGTEKGYELDRVPTRAEILVMIIRMLGKEQDALLQSFPHPFCDTQWEDPYVSYGYNHGIVKGVSADSFGGSQQASLNQYCTMLLRVLGYDDAKGDFSYENAVSFATLVLGEGLTAEKFDRGEMAEITCHALNTRIKGNTKTLGQTLAEQGVFSQQQFIDAQRYWEQNDEYTSTTVLIYTVGSDLESQQGRLTNDLNEILRAAPKENCSVLLQTGGTLQYQNEWMTNGKAERFRVMKSDLQKEESHIATKACEAQTLTDFIEWGAEEAPAERYILVLWDHGYGIKGGFGADELNQNKTIPVSEISTAIMKAGVFFDIIAFDACLMGTVETAYALRNQTKYLIASEQATPACGLYYTTWLGALERNPAITTQRLGRVILDSFSLHAGIEANIPTTISIMDVSRAETLVNQMSLFSGDLLNVKETVELLGKNEGIFDQFDLLSIMDGTPQITAAAQALAYEVRNSSAADQYCGTAIYVPAYKPEDFSVMKEELKKIGFNQTYLHMIATGITVEE